MQRRLILFVIISANLLFALVLLQMPLDAAPGVQNAAVRQSEPTPLAQPVQLHLQQLLPVTLTFSSTADAPTILPITLALDLRLSVTQTLTSTVASTITLQLADNQTVTLPISLTLGESLTATLVVTPLTSLLPPPPTATPTRLPLPTATFTPRPTATATSVPTPTATLTPTVAPLQSTVNITANLRAGPSTEFAILGQAIPGQTVQVVAVAADGLFYLLDTGQWIATGLVDNVPTNLPLATDALIASLLTPAPLTGTVTITVTETPTAPVPTATTAPLSLLPTPTPEVETPSTVNVNANLRAGPGQEFAIIGGTVAGQTLNIVGRNADGSWFRLDNGGWVAAFLVINPPALAAIPVIIPNQTPTTTVTTTTAVSPTTVVTATTPITATPAVTSATLDPAVNLYLLDAQDLIARYERALAEIDRLTTQAGANNTLLQNQTWTGGMQTAITLMQDTNRRVRALAAPTAFTDIQEALLAAATAYEGATAQLARAVSTQDVALFDPAFAAITRGDAELNNATDQIAAVRP